MTDDRSATTNTDEKESHDDENCISDECATTLADAKRKTQPWSFCVCLTTFVLVTLTTATSMAQCRKESCAKMKIK